MKKLTYLLFACVIVFSNCNNDDDDDNNSTCTGGSMTINFDGQSSTQTTFNNTYLAVPSNGMTGYRLDLRTNVNGGTFVLSVSNWDVQNPPPNGVKEKRYSTLAFGGQGTECIDVNGTPACDEALVTFVTDTLLTYMSIDDVHDGHITITDCDNTAKKVSGTFDALLIQFANDDTIPVSGTFTNLCYTVL